MATQSFDNYTITNVTYQVIGGTNVYLSHQTAVLTISPNTGFTVTASDFSWINTSLANVNTVVFTQSGVNVVVTVTFDNPFTMPGSATTLGLCIAGAAKPSSIEICGIYIAEGTASNMAIVSESPVPEEISYQSNGVIGQEVLLLDKTYTAASNYYFDASFIVEYSGPGMIQDNYNIVETKAYDASNNHTSSNFKVYYTIQTESVYQDVIKIKVPKATLINVPVVKIRNYVIEGSLISPGGDERTLRVFGSATATFTLASNNGQIINPFYFQENPGTTLYTTTPTLTMPSSGFYDIKIFFPASASVAQYCFTLAGGNLVSPFPKLNPFCLNQYPDVTLTFNTTGTSNGQTFNVVGSPVTKTFTANTITEQNSGAYLNEFTWTVTAANAAAMTLTGGEANWSNLPDIITSNTSAVSNSATVPVVSTTGLSTGMRMLSNTPLINVATTGNPPAATITNISGSNLTISPNQTLSFASGQLQNLLFSSQKGNIVSLPTTVTLDQAGTTATVKVVQGEIERYGDSSLSYTLDLTSVLTIGSANACIEYNVVVGSQGGSITYFDCITKSSRVLFVNKGDSNFSICALTSPAPVVTGSLSFSASGDVCDNSGVDATCATWSIVYNPTRALAKSVNVTYIDCVSLQEQTISVGIGATATTQCATRQIPVSTDPGDGGATITLTNLTCTP